MTTIFNVSRRATLLILLASAIAACNTTPERETPPPKPRPIYEPQQQQSQQQQSQQQQSQQQQSQSAQQQQTYMAPSEDAAEVEVEEIRLDGQADAAQQNQRSQSAQSSADRGAEKRRQGADFGGASAPRYAESNSADRDPAQSGGMVMLPPGRNTDDEDMIGPQMNVGARTETEQIAALDDELSGQMADFDARLRRARAAAEAEKMQHSRGGSAGMQGGRGQRYEAPQQERGAGGAAATSSGAGNTPDLTGASARHRQQIALAARPAGIPDGRDDDIVARQLREAATKESDPVLREKLWEEYRKYKAGL